MGGGNLDGRMSTVLFAIFDVRFVHVISTSPECCHNRSKRMRKKIFGAWHNPPGPSVGLPHPIM